MIDHLRPGRLSLKQFGGSNSKEGNLIAIRATTICVYKKHLIIENKILSLGKKSQNSNGDYLWMTGLCCVCVWGGGGEGGGVIFISSVIFINFP